MTELQKRMRDERVKRWIAENPDRRKAIANKCARKAYASNPEKFKAIARSARMKDLPAARKYSRLQYLKNADAIRARARASHAKNRAHNIARGKLYCARTIARRREVRREIRARDIREKNNAYFATLLRSSLIKALSGQIKAGAAMKLLGCPMDLFRLHLQNQFRDGMEWNNHGKHWHIDHKKPCASFDLSNPEQQAVCFHYSNMQPLLVAENLRKGARV